MLIDARRTNGLARRTLQSLEYAFTQSPDIRFELKIKEPLLNVG